MGQRLPRANWQTTKLTNANLKTQAQAMVNGLTAAVGTYPTPPFDAATLQATLNNYATALAASIGGSELQRKTMAMWREELRSQIRADGQYVNQITWNNIANGQTYEAASEDIVSSGYPLGAQPSPVGPLPNCQVKKYGSLNSGQFNIQLIRTPGAKGYSIELANTATGDVTFLTFSSTRIVINGLTSGVTYDAAIAAVGTNPSRVYGLQITQVIT